MTSRNELPWQEVSRILYAADPQGFARMGAPPDEYDNEAQTLATLPLYGHSAEHIADQLHLVFRLWFGDWRGVGTPDDYLPAAQMLVDAHRTPRATDTGVDIEHYHLVDGRMHTRSRDACEFCS